MYKKKNWDITKNIFLSWLNKNELKKEFCKKIKYKHLSLWWATKLVDKDIALDNQWYLDLNAKLNHKKIDIKKKNFYFIFFFLKLVKNFIFNIIFITFIKFFFNSKNNNKSKKKINCYYSSYINTTVYKKIFINKSFSFAPLKKKQNNCYLTELQFNKKLFINFFETKKNFSKMKLDNHVVHSFITYKDIWGIYTSILCLLFKTVKILNKKNYFILNNKDCSKILKPLLLDSFSGNIQNSLIISCAIKNFLTKHKYKKFITYGEFFPNYRSIYSFVDSLTDRPKILSVNHGIYNKDNLFYHLDKKDFSQKTKDYLRSPEPDIFFSQGRLHFDYLKKIFPKKKIFQVGSFKFDLLKNINKKISIKKKIQKINKTQSKKIIAVITAIKDEDYIVNFLNKCNLSKFQVILCPHPAWKKETKNYFSKNLKVKFLTLNNYSSREAMSSADLIICGYSSMAYEAFFNNLNIIRVEDYYRPNWTDHNDGIPILKNPKALNKYILRNKKTSKSLIREVKSKYFYKYDQNTHKRFCNIIDKL